MTDQPADIDLNRLQMALAQYPHPELLEIFFDAIQPNGWRALFLWVSQKQPVATLGRDYYQDWSSCQIDDFLAEREFFITTLALSPSLYLDLEFLELDYLQCGVDSSELHSDADLQLLLATLEELRQITNTSHYQLCPEFKRDQPLIKNGRWLG